MNVGDVLREWVSECFHLRHHYSKALLVQLLKYLCTVLGGTRSVETPGVLKVKSVIMGVCRAQAEHEVRAGSFGS